MQPPPGESDPAGKAPPWVNAGLCRWPLSPDDAIARMEKAMKISQAGPGLRAKENILAIHEARMTTPRSGAPTTTSSTRTAASRLTLARDQNRKLEFVAERSSSRRAARPPRPSTSTTVLAGHRRQPAAALASRPAVHAGQPRRALHLFGEL
jgi:hypothetical protein